MRALTAGVVALVCWAAAVSTASAQDDTEISLVHGLVGVTVDLVVDGATVVDGLAPGAIEDLTDFAGERLTNVEVIDEVGDTVVGPIPVLDLPASGSWSLAVHLDEDGDVVITPFENDLSATASPGGARVTFRHAAAAPAIDVVVDGGRPATNLTNGLWTSLELPAGQLSPVQIAPAGAAPTVDLGAIALAADTHTIVYIVGSVDDGTITDVIQVVDLPAAGAATTTTVADSTTTTTVDGTTTTTSTTTTTTTVAAPSAVNTGSPIGGSSAVVLALLAVGGLALAGGGVVARRRL